MYATNNDKVILLVDDDRDFHRKFKSALPPRYKVVSAYSPSEALKTAKTERLDAVLLDLDTPLSFVGDDRSAGLDLLQRIGYCADDGVAIIAVIESDITPLLSEYVRTRADAIIKKPSEMKAFVDEMERCLGQVGGDS